MIAVILFAQRYQDGNNCCCTRIFLSCFRSPFAYLRSLRPILHVDESLSISAIIFRIALVRSGFCFYDHFPSVLGTIKILRPPQTEPKVTLTRFKDSLLLSDFIKEAAPVLRDLCICLDDKLDIARMDVDVLTLQSSNLRGVSFERLSMSYKVNFIHCSWSSSGIFMAQFLDLLKSNMNLSRVYLNAPLPSLDDQLMVTWIGWRSCEWSETRRRLSCITFHCL
jgi:hypothetical protein